MTNAKRQILTTPKPAAKLRAKRISLVVVGILLLVSVYVFLKPQQASNTSTTVVTSTPLIPTATSTVFSEQPTEEVAIETGVVTLPEVLPVFDPKSFKMQYEGSQYRKIGEDCYEIPGGWILFSSYKNNPGCSAEGAIDLRSVVSLPSDFGVAPAGPLPYENYYQTVNGEAVPAVEDGWTRICNVEETVNVSNVDVKKFHVFIDTKESHSFSGRRSGGCFVVRDEYELQTLHYAVRMAYEQSLKYTFYIAEIDPTLSGHWFGKQPLQVLP